MSKPLTSKSELPVSSAYQQTTLQQSEALDDSFLAIPKSAEFFSKQPLADDEITPPVESRPAPTTDDNLSTIPFPNDGQGVAQASFEQSEDEGSLPTPTDNSALESSAPEPDSLTAPPNTNGETTGETFQSISTPAETPTSVDPDSFIGNYWPYLLVAVTLLGWGFSQLFARREPSFKPQPIKRTTNPNIENPRGQFKKSERFLTPKNKKPPSDEEEPEDNEEPKSKAPPEDKETNETKHEATATAVPIPRTADPNVIEGKLTKRPKQADEMQVDQPADDEFNFDLNNSASDFDMFNDEDAAEINQAVDAKKPSSSSKRFKTEPEDLAQAVISDDEFEIDDEFDDQDSQLSLADSDGEFGFDLDDDESSKFLDSGNLVDEAAATVTQATDAGLDTLGVDEIEVVAESVGLKDNLQVVEDVAAKVTEVSDAAVTPEADSTLGVAAVGTTAAAAAAATKGGSFFSRLFGGKKKKQVQADVAEAVQTNATGQLDELADVPDTLDDAVDSLGVNISDVADSNPVESLVEDNEDDFNFDLEVDDDDMLSLEDSDEDIQIATGSDDSDADGSGEFDFDLEDADDTETPAVAVDAVEATDSLAAETLTEPEVELSEDVVEMDGSGEFDFDLEDANDTETPAVVVDAVEEEADSLVAETTPEPEVDVPEDIVDSNDKDSSEFGFGLFDEDAASIELEDAPADAEPSIAAPVAGIAAAVTAGVAGIALSGAGSGGNDESDSQWQAQVDGLKEQNQKLTSQVTALTKQLDSATKKSTDSESLQSQLDASKQEHESLTETVASLTAQKDTLTQEKEALVKEKEALTEEKDALTEAKDALTEEKDSFDSEKKELTDELASLKEQQEAWEQEKADLLKEQEELKAAKDTADSELESMVQDKETSDSELTALQAEVDTFAEQRTAFESEIQTLQTKLTETEAKPDGEGFEDDIEDLKKRFKLRLAAEHRKRKEAQLQVDQAEEQRNEVAKLLRTAKSELLALKNKADDDDFELAD